MQLASPVNSVSVLPTAPRGSDLGEQGNNYKERRTRVEAFMSPHLNSLALIFKRSGVSPHLRVCLLVCLCLKMHLEADPWNQ